MIVTRDLARGLLLALALGGGCLSALAGPVAPAPPGPAPTSAALAAGAAPSPDNGLQAEVDEVAEALAAVRELSFRQKIDVVRMTPEQARAALAEELDRELSPADAARQVRLLSILGLLPERYPLREKLLEVLGEQVAGFYLPRRRQLVVVDLPAEKLRAAMGGASADALPVLLAHELDHALTDQHFDLVRLLEDPADRERDDVLLARQSLAEGDATLAMMLFYFRRAGLKPTPDSFPSVETLRTLMQNLGPGTFPQLTQAPAYVKSQLLEPYLLGLDLVVTAWKAGGWKAVDDLWKNPPASTKQLLHLEHRTDPPVNVEIKDLPPGYDAVTSMEIGELGLRTWLAQKLGPEGGARAAAGWSGDRAVLLERRPGATNPGVGPGGAGRPTAPPHAAALLVSVWDSPAQAEVFAQAAEKWLRAAGRSRDDWRVEQQGRQVRMFLRPASAGEGAAAADDKSYSDRPAVAPEKEP